MLSVRKRDGSEYEPDTLSGILNSIDRHFRNLKLNIDLKKDKTFSHSRRVLEAKRKHLKSEGKGSKKNKAESLDAEETKLLYEKQILGSGNPQRLLNTLWMNNGVYFGFRGRQDHVNLLLGDLELKKDSSVEEYVEFTERSKKKTRSSGDNRPVTPKMFAKPHNPYCPVKMRQEYMSHRPVDYRDDPSSRCYLHPLKCPREDVWYSKESLGKNTLGKMMKTMSEEGGIQGRKVNHSTRKTFATTLLHSDTPNTEVAQLGGWKNVATLSEYSVPSHAQQQKTSSILSDVMLPKVTINKTEESVTNFSEVRESQVHVAVV